eukprot:Ihof_evm1s242 gene=Ihof_evmTU1s242
MGAKNSRVLTIEEVHSRVTAEEMSSIEAAIQRLLNDNGVIERSTFFYELLDIHHIPPQITERIYQVFNGHEQGVTKEAAICGIVTLQKATTEEKKKLVFEMFDADQDGLLHPADLAVFYSDQRIPKDIQDYFMENNKVMDENLFNTWLDHDPEQNISLPKVKKANLEDTLASVTHFSDTDIRFLQKKFEELQQSPSGKVDIERVVELLSPPLPEEICKSIFRVLDRNDDGHVDFRELVCGLSSCCRGTMDDKLSFCFHVFKGPKESCLSPEGLEQMLRAIWDMEAVYQRLNALPVHSEKEGIVPRVSTSQGILTPPHHHIAVDTLSQIKRRTSMPVNYDCFVEMMEDDLKVTREDRFTDISSYQANQPVLKKSRDKVFHRPGHSLSLSSVGSKVILPTLVDSAFQKCNLNGKITLECFLSWARTNPLPMQFVETLAQVSMLRFGLRPKTRADESEMIRQLMLKHKTRGLEVGAQMYVLNADWWEDWKTYVAGAGILKSSPNQALSAQAPGPIDNHKLLNNSCPHESLQLDMINNEAFSASYTDKSASEKAESIRDRLMKKIRRRVDGTEKMENNGAKRSGAMSGQDIRIRPVSPSSEVGKQHLPCPRSSSSVPTYSEYGQRLKWNLVHQQDYVLVPESVWTALDQWYTAHPVLPRAVISSGFDHIPEVELYPLTIQVMILNPILSVAAHKPSSDARGSIDERGTGPRMTPVLFNVMVCRATTT